LRFIVSNLFVARFVVETFFLFSTVISHNKLFYLHSFYKKFIEPQKQYLSENKILKIVFNHLI